MAGSVNKVILIGHLGRDPEIRTVGSGDRVANFSLATSDSWRDKSTGERRERTEWHKIVVWNENIVKVVENYLRKGSSIYVEGSLQTRNYEKDGVTHYVTEVVIQRFGGQLTMLGGKQDGNDHVSREDGNRRLSGGDDYSSGFSTGGGRRQESYDLNDDIPF